MNFDYLAIELILIRMISMGQGVDKFLARWRKRRILLYIELSVVGVENAKIHPTLKDFPTFARSFCLGVPRSS